MCLNPVDRFRTRRPATGQKLGPSEHPKPRGWTSNFRGAVLADGFDAFFRAAVRDGRELGAKEASTISTGAVWLAGEAKGLGLVDRVEPLDAAVERLTALLRARAAKARLGSR